MADGFVDHPPTELDDVADLFADRDEVGGWHLAEHRMLPTQQRFEARHPAVAHLDDRLVVHRQLVAVDGQTDLALERQAADDPVVHGLVEGDREVAAVFLGRVHGGVGFAEQRLGVVQRPRPTGHRDADARGDRDRRRAGLERGAEGESGAFGDLARLVLVAHRRQDDDELVAADPHDEVIRTHVVAQAVRHGPQQLVARSNGRGCR